MSITNEEIDNAINNIETYEFKTLFKKDNHKSWLNSILKVKNRHKAYPMFWLLNDEKKSYKLSKQLKILKTNCKKYNSIIKKLIKDDFDSALTEIEVISYFYENFDSNSIEYEPKTGNGNKKADLKLTYRENDYYFEIALLKDDKETKNMENLWNKIQKRLREQNCCYDMICEVEPCVNGVNEKEEDIDQFIDGFINFIQENFKKIDKSFLYVNNGFKADITFSEDGLGPIQFSSFRAPNIPRMKKNY